MEKKTGIKTIAITCAVSTFISVLAGCSSSGNAASSASAQVSASSAEAASSEAEPITLSVSTNAVGDQATILKSIADDFHKANPNITINFTAPGSDYENVMKVKMASNQMPDVFATHGWAKARYGNYLADLKGESWASKINSSIKSFITDDSGKVYVLPMDMDVTGINYNVDILKQYNISVPKTWDDFLAACETIKTKSSGSVTPIHIGGGDSWTQGQYFDFFAPAALITPATNYKSQLKDGSFNWRKFDVLPQNLLNLWKKGYLNKDYLTSKYEDSATQMAKGKVAFTFYGPSFESEVLKVNANANIGMMPIPAMSSDDKPSFAGGEKTTWGVWKDSKNIDAAKKLVAFYASDENIQKVCKSSGLPSGLSGITVDDGKLTDYFNQYKDVPVYPYFDREYLPDGMWDVMTKNAGDMISGSITPAQFSDNMKSEYLRLRQQSSSSK